jgi:hypothetical protein
MYLASQRASTVMEMRSSDDILSEIYCSEEPRPKISSRSKQDGPTPGYTGISDSAKPSRPMQGREMRGVRLNRASLKAGTLARPLPFASGFVIHSCVTCSLKVDESKVVNAVPPILRLATAGGANIHRIADGAKIASRVRRINKLPVHKAEGPSCTVFSSSWWG